MSKIRIVADSTCDLTPDLIEKHGISILPLNIVLDMTSYSDGEEIGPDEIYAWAEKNRRTPKTAAVAFDRALDLIRPMTVSYTHLDVYKRQHHKHRRFLWCPDRIPQNQWRD